MTSWIGYILFSGTTMDRFGHGHLVFWTILPKKLVTSLKYVVKHKSAKLLMMYAVGKLEAALNISHLILSTSSQSKKSELAVRQR